MASLVEHFGSPMINQGMQQTISVFNLGGVVQHFSSPTGNPISTFGNPISAFADGGSTDTDNSKQAKDLRDIKSLINEYRNCLMQKAVCCASDRMMQSHVYKQKAMECKLKASKLIDSYNEKYGSMENSPFNMVDMDEMNEYADGGEMVIRYSVYDEEGDLVEMGLSASELIELASTIYYYDAMDSDEENISTLDEAMDGFEAMGYSVRESEYGFSNGGEFGGGGEIDALKKTLNQLEYKRANWMGVSESRVAKKSPFDDKIYEIEQAIKNAKDKSSDFYEFPPNKIRRFGGKSYMEKIANYFANNFRQPISYSKFLNSLKTPMQKEAFRRLLLKTYQGKWNVKPIINKTQNTIRFRKEFADGGVTKNLKRIVRKGTKYGKLAVNKAKPKAKKIIRKAKLGFDALAKKVAQAYEGKKVAPKYQKQYGKTYSKQEAQEVGNKVAAKVKMMKGL